MQYIIAFRRNDLVGLEEYDGGTTIAEARKEAQFFRQNLPDWVTVRICKVKQDRLKTIEYVDACNRSAFPVEVDAH